MVLDTRAQQVADEHPDVVVIDSYAGRSWNFAIGLPGGTNCGSGQTPPLHTNDFRLKRLYGIGLDWPLRHDDLEAFCCGPGGRPREKLCQVEKTR